MKGVLLINMGGPETKEEMKSFLKKMFLDPFIIPYNSIVRKIISILISNMRHKKSWRKYQLVNGTPIIKNTKLLAGSLQKKLGNNVEVRYAFSYSNPSIEHVLDEFRSKKIQIITAVPLYPQPSFVTTGSVKNSISGYLRKSPGLNIKIVEHFFSDKYYIEFWADIIRQHIQEVNVSQPLLIFSAHSIPLLWLKKGDTYREAVNETATLVSKNLGYEHIVAFQSAMSGSKWLGPGLLDSINHAVDEGCDSFVIVPVSFVSENLETLYDLDKILIPHFSGITKVKHISRVGIPVLHNLFLEMLNSKIYEQSD
ncbi:MAG: ferrochelatase [Bacteroidetes bacterium]|nr:ferrochelatase [Bacteroidota bacterium]MBU1717864.1 ferrochelatase [Bacteroidota bacterium]